MQNRHLPTAVNSDLTQIESFFNAYFPLNTVDHIRKIDIMGYHGNGPYLNIQCTTHLLLSSYFRLSSSFVLFRKAKRALWFWAVGYMSNNLTLLVFISSDRLKKTLQPLLSIIFIYLQLNMIRLIDGDSYDHGYHFNAHNYNDD